MEETEYLELSIEDDEGSDEANCNIGNTTSPKKPKGLTWWIRIAAYSLFLLAGQSSGTLFGRLYFSKGGNSEWMATVAQLAGFPILIPYYFKFLIAKNPTKSSDNNYSYTTKQQLSNLAKTVSVYIVLGLLMVTVCYLFAVGLMNLPVSTFSLISASQLTFNAVFSYFLNSQKFTPYIVNSLVLLTVSSVLLVFGSPEPHDSLRSFLSKGKYAAGFVCTVGGSAGSGLLFSLTQFFVNKVLKRDDFRVIVDVAVWQSVVATLGAVAGLFASGEWAGLDREMGSFGLGKVWYVMTLVGISIAWQVYSIGLVGLIMEVSSLFSNVVGALGLPVVPVVAVFLFGESMNGPKVVAMFLAIWGFVSYIYHNYLDTQDTKAVSQNNNKETVDSHERDQ